MNTRKNALSICCYVCAFGAFGAFFRWLQNQIAVDHTTGVLKPSMWNVLVPVIIIAAAAVFYFIIRRRMETNVFATGIHETFRATTALHDYVAWFVGIIVMLGGLMLMISSRLDALAGAYRFIGILAILTGLTFPSVCTASRRHLSPNLVSIFSVIPIAMYCLWLITCYRCNASIPNIYSFCIEIIAVCAIIVALYNIAGYPFGVPKPYASLYSSMLAAFMCLMTLADNRYFGMQLILFGTAAMLLMYSWMIVGNMKTAEDSSAKAAAAAGAAIKNPPEPEISEDTVIPAGADMSGAEPTRRADTIRADD